MKSVVLEVFLKFCLNVEYTNEIKFIIIVIYCFSLTTPQPQQQQGGGQADVHLTRAPQPTASTSRPR